MQPSSHPLRKALVLVCCALAASGCEALGAHSTPAGQTATPRAAQPGLTASPHVVVITPASTRLGPLEATPIARGTVVPPTQPAEAGAEWTSPIDGMTLVYVPPGAFWMGSPRNDPYAKPDELPQHRPQLSAYWIDRTEITNAMYAGCVAAGACVAPPTAFSDFSPHAYYGSPAYADYPVVNVTWQQAQSYCGWAGRRLPTEAEWEKAARGLDGRRFPWEWIGVPVPDKLNFCDASCAFGFGLTTVKDGYAETAPVGAYPKGASPYGALDMAGNVWQWVSDWYGGTYYGSSPASDPTGPATGSLRVLRGGSWLDGPYSGGLIHHRSANRFAQDPSAVKSDIGFRCAMPAPE